MSYDIIVRFPSKEVAEEFTGQMSDGFGEGFCDFSVWYRNPDNSGKAEKLVEDGKPVCFVDRIFEI